MSGILTAGVPAAKLHVLTRTPSAPKTQRLATLGARIVQADLDDPVALVHAVKGVQGVYVHALAPDSSITDDRQLPRAVLLSRALRAATQRDGIARHVVFNATAGVYNAHNPNTLPRPMRLKAAVEDLFSGTAAGGELTFTSVRPAMFAEEWWKRYTRPSVLKGTLPLALPPDTRLQLTSVHDVGRLAALALGEPNAFAGRAISLAGDEMTPLDMAAAFSSAQGSPVAFKSMHAWPLFFIQRDLYDVVRFIRDTGYGVDVASCRREFPWLLSFAEFLQMTHWGDASRSYDSLWEASLVAAHSSSALA